jgi:predicted metal-binding membrane protein
MTIAMMLGPAMPTIQSLALSTLWKRRLLTVWLFVAVYLSAWLGFGIVGHYAVWSVEVRFRVSAGVVVVALLALGAAWEATELKRRGLRACHILRPLSVTGWSADRATCDRAARFALWSMICCWPVMLAMTAGAVHLPLMLLVTGLMVLQFTAVKAPAAWRLSAAVVASAAIGAILS